MLESVIASASDILPVMLEASRSLSTNSMFFSTCLALLSMCFSNSLSMDAVLLNAKSASCSLSSNSLLMAAISLVSSR